MPSKEEVLSNIQNVAHSAAQVKDLIGSITSLQSKAPSRLKRGDVINQCVGAKKRPVVLIKILKDIVVGIPLSTTKDELFLYEGESRFYGLSYFNNQIITASHEYALANFSGTYDNPRAVNEVCKEMRIFLNKVI